MALAFLQIGQGGRFQGSMGWRVYQSQTGRIFGCLRIVSVNQHRPTDLQILKPKPVTTRVDHPSHELFMDDTSRSTYPGEPVSPDLRGQRESGRIMACDRAR